MTALEPRERIKQFQGQVLAARIDNLDRLMARYKEIGAVLKTYMEIPVLTESQSSLFMENAKALQGVINKIAAEILAMYNTVEEGSVGSLRKLLDEYAHTAYGEEHEALIGAIDTAEDAFRGVATSP